MYTSGCYYHHSLRFSCITCVCIQVVVSHHSLLCEHKPRLVPMYGCPLHDVHLPWQAAQHSSFWRAHCFMHRVLNQVMHTHSQTQSLNEQIYSCQQHQQQHNLQGIRMWMSACMTESNLSSSHTLQTASSFSFLYSEVNFLICVSCYSRFQKSCDLLELHKFFMSQKDGGGWSGGASDIVKAESSGEDPRATGGLVSNLPHPRVN